MSKFQHAGSYSTKTFLYKNPLLPCLPPIKSFSGLEAPRWASHQHDWRRKQSQSYSKQPCQDPKPDLYADSFSSSSSWTSLVSWALLSPPKAVRPSLLQVKAAKASARRESVCKWRQQVTEDAGKNRILLIRVEEQKNRILV